MSKYGVISGPYFPVFRLNTEIYEVTPKLEFKKKELSCSMIKQIQVLLPDQIFVSFFHQQKIGNG